MQNLLQVGIEGVAGGEFGGSWAGRTAWQMTCADIWHCRRSRRGINMLLYLPPPHVGCSGSKSVKKHTHTHTQLESSWPSVCAWACCQRCVEHRMVQTGPHKWCHRYPKWLQATRWLFCINVPVAVAVPIPPLATRILSPPPAPALGQLSSVCPFCVLAACLIKKLSSKSPAH